MTYPITLLVCLMALTTPFILSYPIGPSPIDPAIKVKITAEGLEEVTTLLQPLLLELVEESIPVHFHLDHHFFNGSFEVTKVPHTVIKSLANDREEESYAGFESISLDDSSDSTSRDRRSTHPSAKSVWTDDKFIEGKHLGGIETTLKDLDIKFHLVSDSHSKYEVVASSVTLKVSTILGSDHGQLRIARIAGEVEGEVEVTKDGVKEDLTEEKKATLFQEILTNIIKRYRLEFTDNVTKFTQVLGSSHLPHVIFDFRLTEDPQFKDGGLELSVVGKFIYDETNEYTFSRVPEIEGYLTQLSLLTQFKRRDADDEPIGTSTKRFTLFESTTTPHIDALLAEGSDEEEAQRKAQGAFLLSVGEDFFNSLFETLVKAHLFDIKLNKLQLSAISTLLGSVYPGAASHLKTDTLPDDFTFALRLNAVPDHKYVTFHDGKITENFSIRVGYGGPRADYTYHGDVKALFRNGKIAKDYQHIYVDKKFDDGFPEFLQEDTAKFLFTTYASTLESSADVPFSGFSEFSFHDKFFTIGFKKGFTH